MKKRIMIAIITIVCLFTACSDASKTDERKQIAAQVEEALPSEYVKQYETGVCHLFTATYAEGHSLEYYMCNTIYYAADPEDTPKLHTDAFAAVFDVENIPLVKELDISGHAAAIYQGAERNYICCTTSPTVSVVMKYDPDAVCEEDAIKVIRSIYEPMEP